MFEPKSSKVYEVAMTLDLVSRLVCNEVSMHNGDNYEQSVSCGTSCCHAGWFEFATKKEYRLDSGWYEGASRIAKHIFGYYNYNPLLMWFEHNPRIWGNNYAKEMFSGMAGPAVFNAKGKLTLRKIAYHWYEVAERLEAYELERRSK